MKLINIGFGNLVSAERVLAIVSPDSAPIKRLIQESRERGMLIDATYGRKTASVFVMDSDHVVLSAIAAEKLGLTRREVAMFAFGMTLADKIEEKVLDGNNLGEQTCDSLIAATLSLPILLGGGADG